MKTLLTTLCLTIAVLLGSVEVFAESRTLKGVDVARWVVLHTWVDVRDTENPKINLRQFNTQRYPASFESKEDCHGAITKWYLRDGMKIRESPFRLVKGHYPGSAEQVTCISIQLDKLPFKRQ